MQQSVIQQVTSGLRLTCIIALVCATIGLLGDGERRVAHIIEEGAFVGGAAGCGELALAVGLLWFAAPVWSRAVAGACFLLAFKSVVALITAGSASVSVREIALVAGLFVVSGVVSLRYAVSEPSLPQRMGLIVFACVVSWSLVASNAPIVLLTGVVVLIHVSLVPKRALGEGRRE